MKFAIYSLAIILVLIIAYGLWMLRNINKQKANLPVITGTKAKEIKELLKVGPDADTEKGIQMLKEIFEPKEHIRSCGFCYNAHVWAKEPVTEEDYFDPGLNDDNDGFSCGIGHCSDGFSIMFNSGMGRACNIEIRKWHEGYGWAPIGYYYPKFCPECGRPLDEYHIDERGTKYESKRTY